MTEGKKFIIFNLPKKKNYYQNKIIEAIPDKADTARPKWHGRTIWGSASAK